jgi:ankyrin repeat protein
MQDPLHRAIAAGDLAAVRTLLVDGASPNTEDGEDGVWHLTPLHTAAKAGRVEVAALLLDAGARFSWDNAGWSPVHRAVYYGHPEMAAFLLGQGAPLIDPNDYGDTPLHIAADKKDVEAALVLLNHAEAIDDRPEHAGLPRHDAANALIVGEARSRGSVRSLLDWQCTSDGATALHRALEPGFDFVSFRVTAVDPELVELLVGRGADLGLRSRAGERPLDIAIRRGWTGLLGLLGG